LQHRDETQGQIERLEQVFELLGKPACGKTCEAIQGIIAEGEEIMEEYKGTVALDAGLISSAQAVEHYEIARYGTLIAWAKQLGLKDAVPLLQTNFAEEEATDKKLTQLPKRPRMLRARRRPDLRAVLEKAPWGALCVRAKSLTLLAATVVLNPCPHSGL
jgi:ferritin-like metal-binding protein YciE